MTRDFALCWVQSAIIPSCSELNLPIAYLFKNLLALAHAL